MPGGVTGKAREGIPMSITLRQRGLYRIGKTDNETPISCRRRPDHKQCEGNIIAYFDEAEPSAIKWFCPLCGDGGYIRGWEETAWDKTRGR